MRFNQKRNRLTVALTIQRLKISVLMLCLCTATAAIAQPTNQSFKPAADDEIGSIASQADLWTGRYDAYFKKYAKQYFGPFFDWQLFKAQAIAESKLTVDAESWAGAQGIMQIMPATYADIQERNPHFDTVHTPRWNIAAGIYYNRYLFTKLSDVPEPDRMLLTFAAYNAGLGNVYKAQKKAGGSNAWTAIKPYMPKETQGYVERIKLVREYWVLHPGDIPAEVLALVEQRKAEAANLADSLPEVAGTNKPSRARAVVQAGLVKPNINVVVAPELDQPVTQVAMTENDSSLTVAEKRQQATHQGAVQAKQDKQAKDRRLSAVPAF